MQIAHSSGPATDARGAILVSALSVESGRRGYDAHTNLATVPAGLRYAARLRSPLEDSKHSGPSVPALFTFHTPLMGAGAGGPRVLAERPALPPC